MLCGPPPRAFGPETAARRFAPLERVSRRLGTTSCAGRSRNWPSKIERVRRIVSRRPSSHDIDHTAERRAVFAYRSQPARCDPRLTTHLPLGVVRRPHRQLANPKNLCRLIARLTRLPRQTRQCAEALSKQFVGASCEMSSAGVLAPTASGVKSQSGSAGSSATVRPTCREASSAVGLIKRRCGLRPVARALLGGCAWLFRSRVIFAPLSVCFCLTVRHAARPSIPTGSPFSASAGLRLPRKRNSSTMSFRMRRNAR